MNRKMTLFALPGNCEGLGASGFAERPVVAPFAFLASNSASEIVPSPTPHCCKNQRRLTAAWVTVFVKMVLAIHRINPDLLNVHLRRYSLVIVSSRFKRTRETAVHPASSPIVVPAGSDGRSFL